MMVLAAARQAQPLLPVANALAASLTAESLVFAAMSVTVALSGETEAGRPILGSLFRFACFDTLLITAAAMSALAAWYHIFCGDFPNHETGVIQAVGLFIAIVGQPVLAGWIAFAMRGR